MPVFENEEAPAAAPLTVLEFFTSQGCSSCPPAADLLRELNERALAGVTVVLLGQNTTTCAIAGAARPMVSAR